MAVRLGPAAGARELPRHRDGHRRRRSHRRAGDPPRLRLPVGERRLRRRPARDAGIVFVGPPADAIEAMGDKITAKNAVAASGVPVVPGIAEPGLTDDDLIARPQRHRLPGAGQAVGRRRRQGHAPGRRSRRAAPRRCAARGARRRRRSATTPCSSSASSLRPRHIEVQVLADAHGNVVHLGERECSLQRRHQKVIEEAPSPLLDAATRARIGAAAVQCGAQRRLPRRRHGRVHRLRRPPDEFFFMEMNTRLQVEHPVTETGHRPRPRRVAAAGRRRRAARPHPGRHPPRRARHRGARLRRGPGRGFLPTGGAVLDARRTRPVTACGSTPGCSPGTVVGSDYDPMLAKVIAARRRPRRRAAQRSTGRWPTPSCSA